MERSWDALSVLDVVGFQVPVGNDRNIARNCVAISKHLMMNKPSERLDYEYYFHACIFCKPTLSDIPCAVDIDIVKYLLRISTS